MTVSANEISLDYQGLLFRPASSSEINIWSNLDTNAQVLAGIEHSPEILTYVDPLIRLYQGAFDRAPDVNGLSANVNVMRDGHISIFDMANAFVNSAEFAHTYGSLDDDQFIQQLYHNVLNRDGSQAEIDAWLATGADRAHLLVGFTESSEFIADSASGVQHYLDQLGAGEATGGGPLAGLPQNPFQHNPDATLDMLGQSQAHPGTMLTGNGIPVDHGVAAINTVTGTELWMRADYRTTATAFTQTGVDADGTVHLQGLAGTQDGSFGEDGANAGRGHLALNFAAISGVNGLENNQIKLFLDTDPSSAVNYKELDLHVIDGHQVWTTPGGTPVIGDDPQNAPSSVAENTANMMFDYWLGNATPPAAGHYDVLMTETSVVGTMSNHIVIDLIPPTV